MDRVAKRKICWPKWPLAVAKSRRPRRIAITSDGALWYSDYARGYLGRFDPQASTVREWPSPGGANSGPYGIATLGDVVWYIRNMATTRDGKLVLACSGVDRIALVDVHQHE
jgi:virginiamycin B lyase